MYATKKKILFFLPINVGGAERVTVTIAKMLPAKEYDVRLYLVGEKIGDIQQFIPKNFIINLIRVRNIWALGFTKIFLTIKKEKPYATFSSLMYLNARVALASHLAGVKKCIIRNNNHLSYMRKDHLIISKYLYPFASTVIAQQEEMKDDLIDNLGLDSDKVIVLHNPIDVCTIDAKLKDCVNPFPQNKHKNFVWVGRFSKEKGQDILVKAFAKVKKKLPDAHLYLVGRYGQDKKFYNKVKELILENQLMEFVHLIGHDSNPYKWVKYCDCFVLPSRIEGLPNSLIEAQYLGKPCAATLCIPMIGRIIDEGNNGYLADNQDDNSLAESMIKAVALKQIRMTYKCPTNEDFIKLFN